MFVQKRRMGGLTPLPVDTLAMGVVVVTIHAAEVKAADIGGTSGAFPRAIRVDPRF